MIAVSIFKPLFYTCNVIYYFALDFKQFDRQELYTVPINLITSLPRVPKIFFREAIINYVN